MGRPSKYTPELVESIAERLSQGEPLAQICRDDGMPHPSTIRDWMDERENVSRLIARAREDGFDAIALDALRIADYGENDTFERDDGSEEVNSDVIQRSKLRVDTRLKLLAKWDPKRYGDRMTLANDADQPFGRETDERLTERFQSLLDKAIQAESDPADANPAG